MDALKVLFEFVVQNLTPAGLAIFGLIIAIIYIWSQLQRTKNLKTNYEERLDVAQDRLTLAKETRVAVEHRAEKPSKPIETSDTALKPVAPEEEEPVTKEKPAIEWVFETVTLVPETQDELEPKTPGEWREEVWKAFSSRDIEQLEEAFDKLQDSEEEDTKKLQNKAAYLFFRYSLGDTSALGELQDLAKQSEVSNAYVWIGECYRKSGDFEKAAEAFELSGQSDQTDEERADTVVSLALCLFEAGKQEEACARIIQELQKVTVPDAVYTLYKLLASLYKLTEERELQTLALEKALEIRPNDTSLLFDVAYAYGQTELRHLEVLHYNTLLQFAPNEPGALNNLGVCYEHLQMPILSVKFFKKAAELDHTLAAANLAYRSMGAGFTEEARQILDKARQQPEVHPNVGRALATLSEKEKKESESEKSFLSAAREQQKFLRSFAEAYFIETPDCPGFDDEWIFPDGCKVTISQTGAGIEAEWENTEGVYRLEGHVSNWAAKITISEMSVLGHKHGEDSHGWAYLSPDGNQLHIMTLKKNEHSIMSLERGEMVF